MGNRASAERAFPAPVESLRAALADALNELGWEWIPGPRGFTAVWTSRVFRFKDDLEIDLEPAASWETRVLVRSRSRVGHYDWGQNARHIRELFRATDDALALHDADRSSEAY